MSGPGEITLRRPRPSVHPTLRIALLATLLVAAAVGLLLVTPRADTAITSGIPFAVFVVAFLAAEGFVFYFDFQNHRHAVALSELPLVLGLLFLSPLLLVASRLLGAGAVALRSERRITVKVVFNLAMFAAEAALAAYLFRILAGVAVPSGFGGWLALAFTGWAVSFLGLMTIHLAIAVFEGRWRVRIDPTSFLTETMVSVGTVSAGALATAAALQSPPLALFVVFPLGAVFLSLRYQARLSQRFETLSSVQRFTGTVGTSLEIGDLVSSVLSQARSSASAHRAALVVAGDGGVPSGMYVDDGSGSGVTERPVAESGAWRAVIDGGAPATVASDGVAPALRRALGRIGGTDHVLAPIAVDGFEAVLVVADRRGDERPFDADDAVVVAALAAHTGVAFQNGVLLRRLGQQAVRDDLTGLANRARFEQETSAEVEATLGRTPFCVLLLDLDRFKEVNDTLGHGVGDQLLVEAGRRLEAASGDRSLVARLGGDEFAVLLRDTDEQTGLTIARRLIDELHRPFHLGRVGAEIGVSIGLAVAPRDGLEPEMLLQRADVAMYAAKWAQLGVSRYDETHDSNSPRRLSMAAKLRTALEEGSIEIAYQPKMRILDGRITGVEALARWSDEEFGDIGPEEFVALAERVGLMRELSDFMLRNSLIQVREWRRQGLDLSVAVNLSSRDIDDPDLPDRVASILDEIGLPTEALMLELTEHSLRDDDHRPLARLVEMHDRGVQLALDDFGVGYSSLTHLSYLPIDELKIDRSFVFNLVLKERDRRLVRSVVDLSHNMGLTVVAEGVESPRALRILRSIGCDEIQGNSLTRPLLADDLMAWLADGIIDDEEALPDLRSPLGHLRRVQ